VPLVIGITRMWLWDWVVLNNTATKLAFENTVRIVLSAIFTLEHDHSRCTR